MIPIIPIAIAGLLTLSGCASTPDTGYVHTYTGESATQEEVDKAKEFVGRYASECNRLSSYQKIKDCRISIEKEMGGRDHLMLKSAYPEMKNIIISDIELKKATEESNILIEENEAFIEELEQR